MLAKPSVLALDYLDSSFLVVIKIPSGSEFSLLLWLEYNSILNERKATISLLPTKRSRATVINHAQTHASKKKIK